MYIRIRALRKEHKITQWAVAAYLRCDQSLYSRYERGKQDIPLHFLVRLAEYYSTSIAYIVDRTDDPQLHRRAAKWQ